MSNDSSWLRNEQTTRTYVMLDQTVWIVDNQFQKYPCPRCSQEIYGRVTMIHRVKNNVAIAPPELHVNHKATLAELKELLICYNGKGGPAIYEREENGKWVLKCEGKVIGQ